MLSRTTDSLAGLIVLPAKLNREMRFIGTFVV